MMKRIAMALAVGGVLAMAGGAARAAEPVKLTDKAWTLTEFGGETFAAKPSGNTSVFFRSDGKFSGYAFCNSMFSSYANEDGKLTIKPIGITMRACIDPADNDREQAFLKALRAARGFTIEENRLALVDETGSVLARFVTEPQ